MTARPHHQVNEPPGPLVEGRGDGTSAAIAPAGDRPIADGPAGS